VGLISNRGYVGMIKMNNELISAMRKFNEVFGDIVPLREFPQSTTNEEVINAINESVESRVNKLPNLFDYNKLERNKNILT